MESDSELLICICAGESEALETFYQRYMPAIWRYFRARLPGDESSAQDLLSETFLVAIRNVYRFDAGKGSVAGWLTGIARHKLSDLQRRSAPCPLKTDVVADDAATPGAALYQSELRTQVADTMLALSDDERIVLEWKYIEGLPVEEIASRLKRSEKGVEALLYRARNEFRRRFQPDNEPKGK